MRLNAKLWGKGEPFALVCMVVTTGSLRRAGSMCLLVAHCGREWLSRCGRLLLVSGFGGFLLGSVPSHLVGAGVLAPTGNNCEQFWASCEWSRKSLAREFGKKRWKESLLYRNV